MEQLLLKAALTSRQSTKLIADYITTKEYSREFQILFGRIQDYYKRDVEADAVNMQLLMAAIEQELPNKKHVQQFNEMLLEAEAQDVSVVNIDRLILDAKIGEVRNKLAVALANNEQDKINKWLGEYVELQHYDSLDDLNAVGTHVLTWDQWDEVLRKQEDATGTLRLYPKSLDERIRGRLRGGHHIITFAQTNMGKTALNLTLACGFCRQDAPGLYFINEDRNEDLWVRGISCFTGLTDQEIHANPARAKELADKYGMRNFTLIGVAPGNPKQIEALIDKLKPRWVVIDQIRNLDMNEGNKALALDKASTFGRNMAKKYDCIVVSTTQAGDSATNKRALDMGDVDWSNVGVQAQADLLIGMGANEQDMEQDVRYLRLLKNKLTGREETFPVKLNRAISRYSSFGEH